MPRAEDMFVSRSRLVLITLCAGIFAAAVHAVPTAAARAGAAANGTYMYVAFGTGCCHNRQSIWRWALSNGYPGLNPDMKIEGYAWPLATDTAGNLYGVHGQSIFMFPRGSITPSRHVDVPTTPPFSSTAVTAVMVDPNGYLYAAFHQERKQRRPVRAGTPANGVLIYAPNASGPAPPVQVITLDDLCYGLALDAQGELFASIQHGVVQVYANPIAAPQLVRTISGPAMKGPVGIGIDDQGELYVLEFSRARFPTVTSFPDTANGQVKPDRTILLPTFDADGPGMTVYGQYVYLPDSTAEQVLIYQRNGRGHPTPFALPLGKESITDVKVGL
jgi:hypothetical protein